MPQSEGTGPYGKVDVVLVLAAVTYFADLTFLEPSDSPKSLNPTTDTSKRDSRTHSSDHVLRNLIFFSLAHLSSLLVEPYHRVKSIKPAPTRSK